MPDGKTHEQASMIMAWGASTILLGMGTPLPDVAALGAGLLSTRWLSADLDLSISRPAQRWAFLGFIWEPYQRVAKHRSRKSHSAFISTAIRVGYFLFVGVLGWSTATVLAFILVGKPPFFNWLEELLAWRLFWIWLVGLIVGDVLHILMDVTWSGLKRAKRQRQ